MAFRKVALAAANPFTLGTSIGGFEAGKAAVGAGSNLW